MADELIVYMNDQQNEAFMAQQRAHQSRMDEHARAHAEGVQKLLPALLEMVGKPEQYRNEDKRDYFAGQVIANAFTANLTATELADQAYEIADAMMARRSLT